MISSVHRTYLTSFNPCANVEYTPHDGNVTCTAIAPRTNKTIKIGFSVFEKKEKIYYKIVLPITI